MQVICRKFASEQEARRACEKLQRRMNARRVYAPGTQDSISAYLGVDADSAAGFVSLHGPDAEVLAAEAARLGGETVDPGELPDDLVEGMRQRRRRAMKIAGPGGSVRFDYDGPGVLGPDGIVRPF